MAAVGGIPDSTGNRSVCLTGISKEESHAGKMEKTVVFRGRDESSQCFVYSPVPGQKSPFTICAYTVWFVYLVYSVRHTKSKGMKIFYSVLSMLAMVTVLLNVYFTIL